MHKKIIPVLIAIVSGFFVVTYGYINTTEGRFSLAKAETKPLDRTEDVSDIATYYTDNIKYLDNQSTIENSYIRDRITTLNHYYIDENNTLWGTGRNQYWQLGLKDEKDFNNLDVDYTTPVKLAEKVIHIDASDQGFVIFLTEDHNLYGLGVNLCGVLCQPVMEWEELNPHKNIVGTPVPLMEDVIFAVAGRNSILSLTSDGSAWWWGHFKSVTGTIKLETCSSPEPKIMVENARYIACGADFAAVIDKDSNLWTWGNNVWGQCGINSKDDFISEAVNVAQNIDMVWVECLSSRQNNEKLKVVKEYNPYRDITYPYTMFVRTLDKKYYACGIDLDGQTKSVAVYGDMSVGEGLNTQDYTHSYSYQLIPICILDKNDK